LANVQLRPTDVGEIGTKIGIRRRVAHDAAQLGRGNPWIARVSLEADHLSRLEAANLG
jgi:hypothetical protein